MFHAAWPVHFSYPLAMFEPHIRGVRHLLDFSCQLHQPTKVVFVSSVSVAQGWDTAKGPVPENFLSNAAMAQTTGYGASKYVVERVCHILLCLQISFT